MSKYEELLAGVERLENMGGLQEAIELLKKMIEIFPEQQHDLELRILQIMFRQERYEEALDEALEFIPKDDGRIYEWLIDRYYEPFLQESENMRKHNIECIGQYEYYYGVEDDPQVKTLFYNGYDKLVYCRDHEIVVYKGIPEIELRSDEVTLIADVIHVACLAEQISRTKYRGDMPCYEIPIYLYFETDVFSALLQSVDIQGLLKDRRVMIIVGEDQLDQFWGKDQIRFPNRIIGVDSERLQGQIDNQIVEKQKQLLCDKKQIEEYYARAKAEIDERIRNKKPRILFLTSYFTTVLKNHTRDMKHSADKLGLATTLLMEKESLFSLYQFEFYATINEFHPDIIFCIDHFRFEHYEIPSDIVWICWIQDPMSYIMDRNTPEKLGKRDFVLNHFMTWKKVIDVGYSPEQTMAAPVPSNQDIYKPYQLTEEELSEYGCDICFVCHASNVDAHIKETVSHLPEEWQEMVASVYKGYQSHVYETGELFYGKDIFREYISGALLQHYGIELPEGCLNYLVDNMHIGFNEKVFREALVDWILDAGFRNVKLWGNGWKTNPKYTAYAMGAAKNGATLSKIYQASKIVVGNNGLASAAARAWETMLSGGFYLSNYIPEKVDVADIRKIIEVNKDVIMFYNKGDLIEKLNYYLEHEDERQIMIEKGRKVALKKMTFDSLMEKMLTKVAACI